MGDRVYWKNGTDTAPLRVPQGYAEHTPPDDLAPYVACFWTRVGKDDRAPSAPRRVLPDGCVDILLAFSSEDAPHEHVDASVVGTMTRALVVQSVDQFAFYGVRFKPGWALAALGVPALDVTDLSIPYRAVGGVRREHIESLAGNQVSHEQRLAALITIVRNLFAHGVDAPPASVLESVRRIVAAKGNLRVADLAATIGVTRQRLAREFAAHVGIAPKAFARVMRLQAAVARADAARAAFPRGPDWSAIALDLGYFDQPHFIDDFKTLAGITPGEFLSSRDDPTGPDVV